MNFVSPDRLIWLSVAIPIVAFYILRTRLRRQPVATLLFWDQLFDQKRQRALWQRLRHWLSLLLQLAFLALLVAALVDPLWPGQEEQIRQVVIVLDNSASMSAASDGTTRFEQGRKVANDTLSSLRSGDEVALVTAGSSVRVVVGMTDFVPAVRDALAVVEQNDGPTRVVEAIEAARRLTRDPKRREIVVVTDVCFEDAQDVATAGDVRLVSVGEPADNVGITSLTIRRSLVDPIGYAARVKVQNFGREDRECRLSLDMNDQLVDVYPLELPAGESWERTVTQASAEGGVLRVQLDSDDALSVDNAAMAVLPRRPPVPVGLVTEESSLYLESVFNSIPLVDLTVTSVAPPSAPEDGFLVLNKVVPQPLPEGALLVINPQSDSGLWQLGPQIEQAIVAEQDASSPLMPHVQLTNVLLPGARGLQVEPPASDLLSEAGGATLMASLVRDRNRVLILSADLDQGDLPLRIAFPVLMTNAVNWFLGRTGELQAALQTGTLSAVPLPMSSGDSNGEPWAWMDRRGEMSPAAIQDENVFVGPVDHVGLALLGPRSQLQSKRDLGAEVSENVEIRASDSHASAVKTVAVNLSDPVESNLNPRAEPQEGATISSGDGRHSFWFYLACLALGLTVTEWWLYQRRVVT